jgi:3-oxoacyl-[acyl-carrier protein] reductase
MRFDGKVAVVTGGASGIGRAASEILAAGGASVSVIDVSHDAGNETLTNIRSRDGKAIFFSVDVSQPQQLQEAIDETRKTFGPIDILVVSAGIQRYGNALTTDEDQWTEVMGVNLNGARYAAKFCLPDMLGRPRSIRILNQSTTSARECIRWGALPGRMRSAR